MAQRVQISCINKTDRLNPHERIQFIGGVNGDGSRWKMSLNNAIQSIKDDKYSFYVSVNGVSVDVIIADHTGHEYLKTKNDGEQPNNLLSLENCP
jgi:hypothetical protein